MPPGAATRRILWARAAGRCAVCRRPLLMKPARDWPCGAARSGKRGAAERLDQAGGDRYDNLILLCEDHQCTAAGGTGVRSAEGLARIKTDHEEWVRRSAVAGPAEGSVRRYDPRFHGVTLLPRLRSGEALCRLAEGIHSIQYDHDEPGTAQEAELMEGFLRYLRGVVELWKQYDPAERARAGEHMADQILGLERAGLLLFAAGYAAEAAVPGVSGQWSILRLWILREGADSQSAKG